MGKFSCIFLILFLFMFMAASGQNTGFYNFSVPDIDGNEFNFTSLKGKKVLIVNTASECGYTPQYKELEKLYRMYKDSGFVIIGFPANNFGGQEPGSNLQIKEFCTKNYDVSFHIMSKISVKGDDVHPLYLWLTRKDLNGVADATVKWNFHKFLIDESGNWVASVETRKSPSCDEIIQFIRNRKPK